MRSKPLGTGNHHGSLLTGIGFWPRIDFRLANSLMPSGPCTRPMPESFTPPKGRPVTP